ncbi:uncharacterized protein LOC112099776 [Citrus clementina]|uniref:uncharacterized protein LOC112099776 n=1 Tax=Citrus clementina TaxID=85681 RepID=UPI000CED7D89|nr:uncharacterized protein LOC112099776 [Citrus x clementina]
MALCSQQEAGSRYGPVEGAFVNEQNIPDPGHLLPDFCEILLSVESCYQTSAHHGWPCRSITPKHRSPSFWCWEISKAKEKVIEIDDDELDFLPSLLADSAFDPGIPLEPIRSSVRTSARRMSPQITSSTSNSGCEGSSGSKDTLSEDPGENSSEMSSPGTSRPDRKSKVGGRALSEHYVIDFITCTTTVDDLVDLRTRYDIPDDIPLRILGKNDAPSRSPRGYSEPTIDEVKHLYQLKSSPKDADWYYFMSSTKIRKPITSLPTGGGGNWKKIFFFAGEPWGQIAQIDGKNYRGVHYKLKPEPLKEVEAVLANSCSGRELLSTYNFFKSRLVHTDLKMEDVVIGALNQKRPRAHTAKHDQNKDARSAKRVNIAEQVPPLRTLPPPPTKAGESSRTTTDPNSPSLPAGSKPRLPDNRPEHLVKY